MNFSSKYILKKLPRKSNESSPQSNLLDLSTVLESNEQQQEQLTLPRPGMRPLASRSAAASRPMTSGGLAPPPPAAPRMFQCSAMAAMDDDDDEPDTNVVTIKFDKLKDPSLMQAGDAIKCQNCDAYLSNISKIEAANLTATGDHKSWKCEFCSFTNNLQIDNEEIPKNDDVTYLLSPAPGVLNATTAADVHSEYVVYCCDISGSMSVTTRVQGNFRLPTDNIRLQRAEEMAGERIHQARVQERYISRLEAVQVAISENLSKLVKDSPNKRVGLVTFNHEVHSYGDGTAPEITISGDNLLKKESIAEKVNLSADFKPVTETSNVLNEKVLSLEEGGATALGPALYYSVLIAARKPGSKVILCTDGLANKGIGALDNNEDQSTFYNELASFATTKGVSVSIITIKGTDCKLGQLAEVADKTGGLVNIVDPLNIKNEFASILEDQIIATNVTAKFLLHKAMYVKDYENFNNRQNMISKVIGNATAETEVTFEFALKENIDEDQKEVPFQLQIVYNAKDGSKALRILTQMKPLTTDRNVAELSADRTVLAQHFVQSNVRLMQHGKSGEHLYKSRHTKWDGYLKNNLNFKSERNDNFSEEAYMDMERDMSTVMAETDITPNISERERNAFSKVSDESASKGFKLANLKSKLLKKK